MVDFKNTFLPTIELNVSIVCDCSIMVAIYNYYWNNDYYWNSYFNSPCYFNTGYNITTTVTVEIMPIALRIISIVVVISRGVATKVKGLSTNRKITRNIHVEYQSSKTHCSKVIS